MMTHRERYIETLTFGKPDRIPFHPGGGRESTLARWRAEGLPPDRNPTDFVCEHLGIDIPAGRPTPNLGVNFLLIPQFEEVVLERREGHLVVQDWKGNICEIDDRFDVSYLRQAKDFVTRRWIRCPVENAADWDAMRARYSLEAPGRFAEDFEARCRTAQDRDMPLTIHVNGPFWQLREWCGFEGLCMMMIDQPELVDEMARFWTQFVLGMLERILPHVTPDVFYISEDMAYKAKSMISMDMARRFCMPSWRQWSNCVRAADCPLVDVDSDGFVGELIPLWIEAGVNVCDPIEVAAHCDIVEFRERFGRKIAFRQGVDKRCIAKGGQAIRAELKRVAPVLASGGYIPGCDHGVPSDVSWAAFVDYCRLLAEMTGWL